MYIYTKCLVTLRNQLRSHKLERHLLHGPNIPASDGGIVGCGYLHAVVVRVPATCRQLVVSLLVQGGAGHLLQTSPQLHVTTTVSWYSHERHNHTSISDGLALLVFYTSHN